MNLLDLEKFLMQEPLRNMFGVYTALHAAFIKVDLAFLVVVCIELRCSDGPVIKLATAGPCGCAGLKTGFRFFSFF